MLALSSAPAMATEREKVEALHSGLVDERRRLVEVAAAGEPIPPASLLDRLSIIDGTTAAVEAFIEQIGRAGSHHAPETP